MAQLLPTAAPLGVAAALALLGLGLAGCSTADQSAVAAGPALARPVSAGPTGSSSAVHTAQNTYLVECVDTNLLQRPRSFTLSCGDANSSLDALTWTNWGQATASATGTYVENNCDPSCAQGTPISYPVTVAASKLSGGNGRQVYRELTLTFTAAVPSGSTKITTIPLVG